MSKRRVNYDWAQALFNVASSASTDLPTLVKEAGLDPLAGDVTDIDLSGIDLRGQDLSGWDLEYASWQNAKVTGTKLHGARIDLREFTKANDWQHAELEDAARGEVVQFQGERVRGLSEPDINPSAVKAYLDRTLGKDRRMSDWTYEWITKVLRALGFRTWTEVQECIRGYDGDRLSRVAKGGRDGQVSRFEYMLLAGMGGNYSIKHPWSNYHWFRKQTEERLKAFRDHGIKTRRYRPKGW